MQNNKDIISFIRECVESGNVYWTYRSNMRLNKRSVNRETIFKYIQTAEIIEHYQQDFPLPSCLCLIYDNAGQPIHVVIALDYADFHIRFVTVYKPDPTQWDSEFKRRI